MKYRNIAIGFALALFAAGTVFAGAQSDGKTTTTAKERTMTFWHWAEENQPMTKMWIDIIQKFEKQNPGVKVVREQKTFQEMEEKFRLVLASGNAPDISQSNKGFGGAGVYVKDKQLENLQKVAESRGWTKLLSSTFRFVGQYSEKGILGEGDLYGIPIDGNFVLTYYNADLFEKLGIKVPTTLEGFEAAADALLKAGVTPIGMGMLEKWPVTHNWNDYAGYRFTEQELIKYQTLDPNFTYAGSAYEWAAEKLAEHYKKGYYHKNATGLQYNDAVQEFYGAKYGMYITGSWMYNAMHENAPFKVGTFLVPGKRFVCGAGGDLMVVPKSSKNKELAYSFIDINLSEEAQLILANYGGVVARKIDLAKVTDPKNKRVNELYSTIKDNNGFAYFMDWPIPSFWKEQGAMMENILLGQVSVRDAMNTLTEQYRQQALSVRK